MSNQIKWLDDLKKSIEHPKGDSFRTQIEQNKDKRKVKSRQTCQFDLANGIKCNNPLKAAEVLLKREYEDTFIFNDESEPVFIPPVFTSKEYIKKQFGNILTQDIEKELEDIVSKYKSNDEYKWLIEIIDTYLDSPKKDLVQMKNSIKQNKFYKKMEDNAIVKRVLNYDYGRLGETIEHQLYKILQERSFLTKTVIINSLNIFNTPKGGNHCEYDFILLNPARKLIVGIEAKRTFPDKNNKAKDQLKRLYKMLSENLQEFKGWQFVPMIFTENDKTEGHRQVMNSENCIKKLRDVVEENYEQTDIQEKAKTSLRKALEILVFTIHFGKPLTESSWVEYINTSIKTVCTKENVVFYSKEQLQILDEKRLLLVGGYGTGKSFLMQQKVEKLINYDDSTKILYAISGENNPSSLLFYQLKKDWQRKHAIEVVSYKKYL